MFQLQIQELLLRVDEFREDPYIYVDSFFSFFFRKVFFGVLKFDILMKLVHFFVERKTISTFKLKSVVFAKFCFRKWVIVSDFPVEKKSSLFSQIGLFFYQNLVNHKLFSKLNRL